MTDFAGILGHERVKALLSRALGLGRIPPALLFAGPDGVGKKTLALALGRALLCASEGPKPCDRCPSCARSLRGLHPDLFLVEAATKVIKIDQVRETVREIVAGPFEGRARTFVIDEAHDMTEQAANALLKSLEEPPPTSHVILVTASPQALLPTIRSRCQSIRFGPLPATLIEEHLRVTTGASPGEAALRVAASGGSLGAALSLESHAYREARERLVAILESVGQASPMERMERAQALADEDDPEGSLGILRSLLRDVAALRAGVSGLANPDLADRLAIVSRGPLGGRAAALAEEAGEVREALKGNANKLLTMELLVESLRR